MSSSDSIGKHELNKYVRQKMKHAVQHYHITNIIGILFDEILQDLKKDKKIKIFNFGSIYLQQNKMRKYFHIHFKKIMLSSEHRILRFILAKALKNKLRSEIDIDKTFKEN